MSGTNVYFKDETLVEEVDDRRSVDVDGKQVFVTNRSQWIREAMLVRLYLEDQDEWESTLDLAQGARSMVDLPSDD
jgi:hypothetical protein